MLCDSNAPCVTHRRRFPCDAPVVCAADSSNLPLDAPAEWNVVTRVLLVRHAATDRREVLCGSFDVPVSPDGHAALETLVRQPAARPAPDALFTSTLRRAQDVAAALGRVWRLEPQPAEWAREIHCGEVEGMPLEHVRRRFPDLWARNEAQQDDTFAWPGGESYRDFRARIIDGLTATIETHPGGRIAIVTHAGVISQILGVIRNRPAAAWEPDRPQPLTATEIAWQNGAPCIVLNYNDPDWY
jgi:probable phosphoglycerate mutase